MLLKPLAAILLFSVTAVAQTDSLFVQSAAPVGSLGMAPGTLVRVSGFDLTSNVLPSAQLTTSASQTVLLPLWRDDPFVWYSVIPDSAPIGAATFTVFVGRQSYSRTIDIVPSNFGLFASYAGLARAQNQNPLGVPLTNNMTHPARPGDFVTLWGTGLGVATLPQVQVLIGTAVIRAIYAGPSSESVGVQQVSFQLPDDSSLPQGCYVPVKVRVGGAVTTAATISLTRTGEPCRHPFELTERQMRQLDDGGRIYLGNVGLSSMTQPMTDAATVLGGYQRSESVGASFGQVDANRIALATRKSSLSGALVSGLLSFLVGISPPFFDEPSMGCTDSTSTIPIFSFAILGSPIFSSLDIGSALTFSGPAAQTIELKGRGVQNADGSVRVSFYDTVRKIGSPYGHPDQLPFLVLQPGQWTLSAPGSRFAPAFAETFSVPAPAKLEFQTVATIDRNTDAIVRWDGGSYAEDDSYLVTLGQGFGRFDLNFPRLPPFGISCRFPARAGQGVIPASLLRQAPATPVNSPAYLSFQLEQQPKRSFTIKLADGTSVPGIVTLDTSEAVLVQIK